MHRDPEVVTYDAGGQSRGLQLSGSQLPFQALGSHGVSNNHSFMCENLIPRTQPQVQKQQKQHLLASYRQNSLEITFKLASTLPASLRSHSHDSIKTVAVSSWPY